VILELEEVHEVAVIGVEDPTLGEAIKAFVVPLPDKALDEKKISGFLKRRLAPIKQPKFIEFRENLPKNASGKIIKSELAKK
jgi:acyl-coenzyme A synthetase/AMP-(fatty) acid ligase